MINKIKNKLKATLLLGFLLLGMVLPLSAKASNGPAFNFLPDDPKMVRGLNDSAGDVLQWRDPVAGVPGDTFSGLIYYHNGYLDTTAVNTRVKIDLPVQSVNGKVIVKAHVWADNAPVVTDTVAYTFPEDVRVNFMPERTTWFPEYHAGTPSVPLLGGQTGIEIVGPNGLAVGNVQGCWEHIGYVRFQFQVEKMVPEVVNMKIDKTVRNVSANQQNFTKENQALAGDTLEYKVIIKNEGNGGVSNAVLSDLIPANTAYIPGSARIIINGSESHLPDGIVGDGVPLGPIAPGYCAEVRLLVKTSPTIAGNEVLVNTAYLNFNKITISSQACTKITKVIPPSQPGGGPGLPVTGAETWILPLLLIPAGFMAAKYMKIKLALSRLISK